MQKVNYIATDENLTLILDNKPKQVKLNSKTHRNDLVKAITTFNNSDRTEEDYKSLLTYLEPIKRIQLEADGRFELEGNSLFLKGTNKPIEAGLADKILDFIENGLDIDALVKFWESCLRNPNYEAIKELFQFLENNNLPVTDNGSVLGYKKLNFSNDIEIPNEFNELIVSGDIVTTVDGKKVSVEVADKYLTFIKEANNPEMKDVHSGKIKQKIGKWVEWLDHHKFLPNLDNEEIRQSCGVGFHIGGWGYRFAGQIRVLCEFYPEDVIASNPDEKKLRVLRYLPVSFVDSQKEIKELLVALNSPQEEDFDEDFDEFED